MPELSHLCCEQLPLGWNDPHYLDAAMAAIERLRLAVPDVGPADTWRDVVDQVWVYVDSLAVPGVDSSVLISELRSAGSNNKSQIIPDRNNCSVHGAEMSSLTISLCNK